MKVAVVFLAAISLALAEPPVPSSEYLPANQYIPPSNQYSAPKPFSLPSNTYGAPSNAYGAPSNAYGAPSNAYGAPSNAYGAPAQTQAVIRPNNLYGPPKSVYGAPGASSAYLPPGGYGKGYDYEGEPANYQFEYHVEDPPSGNDFGHQEERQGDVAKGKYFVLLPDGRLQTVEYTADLDGYKPKITYQQVGGGYPSGGPGGYQY